MTNLTIILLCVTLGSFGASRLTIHKSPFISDRFIIATIGGAYGLTISLLIILVLSDL